VVLPSFDYAFQARIFGRKQEDLVQISDLYTDISATDQKINTHRMTLPSTVLGKR